MSPPVVEAVVATVVAVVRSRRAFHSNFLKCIFILLPSIALAQYSSTRVGLGQSDIILNTLFGTIGGLGTGSANVVVGDVFRLLNISIAILGGMIGSVTIFQGVIQTSMQGVFMGKKGAQSGYFTGLRTISGLALVMPVYGGYSALQYIVMSIVLQSTLLASTLAGGILQQMSVSSPTAAVAQTLRLILPAASASQTAYQTAIQNSSFTNNNVKYYYQSLAKAATCAVFADETPAARPTAVSDPTGNAINIQFSSSPAGTVRCGSYEILNTLTSAELEQYRNQTNLILGFLYNTLLQIRYQLDLDGTDYESASYSFSAADLTTLSTLLNRVAANNAQGFVRLQPLSSTATGLGDYVYDWVKFPWLYQAVSMGCKATSEAALFANLSANCSALTDAANYSSLAPKVSVGLNSNPTAALTELMRQISGLTLADTISYPSSAGSSSAHSDGGAWGNAATIKGKVASQVAQVSFDNIEWGSAGSAIRGYWNDPNEGGGIFSQNDAVRGPLQAIIADSTYEWFESFYGAAQNMVNNPALELGNLSMKLSANLTLFIFTLSRDVMLTQIRSAFQTYWAMFAVRVVKDLSLAYVGHHLELAWDYFYCHIPIGPWPSGRIPICPPTFIPFLPIYNPAHGISMGITAAMIAPLAITYSALTTVFTTIEQTMSLHWTLATQTSLSYQYFGIIVAAVSPIMVMTNVLSIWLPMLPSLTFFVALIGWVLAVVEAMVAVPLTALGMAFPQGHDFLGSAQQTLILLLSVFLRAPLIVVGFFIGMMLLSAGMGALVLMSRALFEQNVTALGAASKANAVIILVTMAFMVYVSATLMTYCLSASYRIPSMVIRWVGAQADSGSEQQSIQRVYALLNQQQGSALSSVQQSAQGAEQGGKSIAGSVGK